MPITKTDFKKYLECPAYFWFFKKKREVLPEELLSEFEQDLIKNGQEVEKWARKLFPSAVAVESRKEQAVRDTKEYLDQGREKIFQAAFEAEGLYVMVDILEWDEKNKYWVLNEVKGTSSKEKKDPEHLYDATFQYIVLWQAGINVGRVNLIELNKEFVKQGEINAHELLEITDITEQVAELKSEVDLMIADMQKLVQQEKEPMPCDCIYKARANHCPAFSYLYPDFPDYAVHDIVRIGLSKKKLQELVDASCYDIHEVPDDFKLSNYQRNQVDVEQSQVPIIEINAIKKALAGVKFPLYFLDYETCPAAIPLYDGCKPYQQVPFQFSLHVQEGLGRELKHYEFIHTDRESHPMEALAEALQQVMQTDGTVIVWNKKFEGGCHQDLADLLPERAEVFCAYNENFFDLMEIFSKQLYLHPDFRGSFSIKYVLPVLVPELSYQELNVQNGAMAIDAWKKMVFETEDPAEKQQLRDNLLKYCELDTYAMVRIYEVLRGL